MKKEKAIKEAKAEEKNEEKDLVAQQEQTSLDSKKKRAPLGIKIISVIYYIASVLYLAIAIVAFFKSSWIHELSKLSLLPVMGKEAIIFFGIIFLLLSALSFFIARGLLKLQKWARIALIVICAVNIIGGVFSVIEKNYTSAINLLFNLIIASYLIFSKKVKAGFG